MPEGLLERYPVSLISYKDKYLFTIEISALPDNNRDAMNEVSSNIATLKFENFIFQIKYIGNKKRAVL